MAIMSRLGEIHSRLGDLTAEMSKDGFAVLEVSNYKQLTDGLEYVENFVFAAEKALKKAREEKGHFMARGLDGEIAAAVEKAEQKRKVKKKPTKKS